jgi:hypothetical protein
MPGTSVALQPVPAQLALPVGRPMTRNVYVSAPHAAARAAGKPSRIARSSDAKLRSLRWPCPLRSGRDHRHCDACGTAGIVAKSRHPTMIHRATPRHAKRRQQNQIQCFSTCRRCDTLPGSSCGFATQSRSTAPVTVARVPPSGHDTSSSAAGRQRKECLHALSRCPVLARAELSAHQSAVEP